MIPFVKSSTNPSLVQCIDECNIPPPSTITASGFNPRDDTSTFNLFFRTAFDDVYRASPVSLKSDVGTGANS